MIRTAGSVAALLFLGGAAITAAQTPTDSSTAAPVANLIIQVEARDSGRVVLSAGQPGQQVVCAAESSDVTAWLSDYVRVLASAEREGPDTLSIESEAGLGCHALLARQRWGKLTQLFLALGAPSDDRRFRTAISTRGAAALVVVLRAFADSASAMTARRRAGAPLTAISAQYALTPPTSPDSVRAFVELEVETPVTPRPGKAFPHYPPRLRAAGIEGSVLVQFVVDTSGHADMRTYHVMHTSDPDFAAAVRAVLPDLLFNPAVIAGFRVRQRVQMPFQFSLGYR